MNQKPIVTKWRSETTAVDVNTGEEINVKRVKNGEYVVIKKSITYKIENQNGTRKILWECKPNNQTRLF